MFWELTNQNRWSVTRSTSSRPWLWESTLSVPRAGKVADILVSLYA
jgi:hypothetical protein